MEQKDTLSSALKGLFLLSAASVFLPWFTYNAKVMGYCWGWRFLPWFLPSLVMTGFSLFSKKQGILELLLGELGAAGNLAALILALGQWQEKANIQSGFHWAEGFRTATPAYWLAAVLFLGFFFAFQGNLLQRFQTRSE